MKNPWLSAKDFFCWITKEREQRKGILHSAYATFRMTGMVCIMTGLCA